MVAFEVISIKAIHVIESELRNIILKSELQGNSEIIKLTFFIPCLNNNEFVIIRKSIDAIISTTFEKQKKQSPCISIVAQNPINYEFCMLEILYFIDLKCNYSISFKKHEQLRYCLIDSTNDSFVVTSSTPIAFLPTEVSAERVFSQVEMAFKSIEEILLNEGFDFSDVIRQWTYIENVLLLEEYQIGSKQFYQIYNDVRSSFFEKYHFNNGYMAATGIGSFAGIVETEIIAYKRKYLGGFNIAPVINPKQVNAYDYSKAKLIGTPLHGFLSITTPKFERGKVLFDSNQTFLFLSGTSSVIGQDSIYQKDTIKQVITTVKNIELVLENSNRITANSILLSCTDIKYMRVYLRYSSDMPEISLFLNSKFPRANILFLLATICRDDLNVEIEAYAYR